MTSAAITALPKTTDAISTFNTGETLSNYSEKLSLPPRKSSHGNFSPLTQSIYLSKILAINQRLKRRHGAPPSKQFLSKAGGTPLYKPYTLGMSHPKGYGLCAVSV